MDHERWRQIEAIFHRVVDADESHRESLLNELCLDDEPLRREVESLLAQANASGGLLDHPPGALLAEISIIGFKQGARLGPYQIESLIGQGGMGKVYRALDTRLGRAVAIKTSSTSFIQRFEREARAIAALNHPHICQLYDVGPDYLVMEYIEGTPLKGPLPLEVALHYADQICDALDAAHRQGIIHRDLKPGNILVSKHGIKLLDFGLAQMKAGPEDSTPQNLTAPGAIMGTPRYMPPEQWTGKRADARFDIYSFGCLLYEMLTGKRAGPLTAVADLGPEASPELRRILVKCLEEDPNQRYQHASEIRADLLRMKQAAASTPAAISPGPGARAVIARHWKPMVPAAALLIGAAVAGYFYHRMHAAAKLADTDTIVLADFDNQTGDSVFDGTLRQGLSAELEQTPFLQLLPDGQIGQTLGLMEKPPDTRLTSAVAREVCRRANATADIEGSIAALGNQYVIGLIAVDCRSGETLAREQVTANGKEGVLTALGSAASKLRAKLGETRASLEKFDTPLEQATTPSLEALQAYTLGRRAMVGADVVQAPTFFQQAIRLDPNFAIAYARLGTSYKNLGELELGIESTRQAYQMHEHVSEPEKLYIDSHYYQLVTGDMEKARQVFELWAQTYPRDWTPVINLGGDYTMLGQYDKALEEHLATLRLHPNSMVYYNVADSYLHLNRQDEARSTAKQALSNKLDSPNLHLILYRLAFLQGDSPAMSEESRWAEGQPGVEDLLLSEQSDTAAYYGRLGEARNLSRLAVASAERSERQELAAAYESTGALREALFGNAAETRRRSAAALSLSDNRYVQFEVALSLAYLGDGAKAQHLADDLEKRFPEDTVAHCNFLPAIRAQLALNNRDSSKAIEILGVADACELGLSDMDLPPNALYPAYVRGEAFLEAHQGREAAAEFQKILDHSGIVLNEPIAALARLQLGRAYAIAGDTTKARDAYRDFLALWKNADPEIPILKRAKAEYEKLK